MKKSILIPVNFSNVAYLHACVMSIRQNVLGYDEIVIVQCDDDLELEVDGDDLRIEVCAEAQEIDREYLTKSYVVLHADLITGADIAAVMVPNFMVCKKFNLDKQIVDEKPIILCDSYAALSRQTGDIFQSVQNWQTSTEAVLGFEKVDLEFARSMPIMVPTFILLELRRYLKKRLGVSSIVDYLNTVDNEDVPEGFCFNEFNVIGAYLYEKHYDAVNWIIMSKARNLARYLPPTVGIFELAFNREEVGVLLEIDSKREIYDPVTRKYLKELAQKA